VMAGKVRMQPVYVEDVAKAAAKGATGEAPSGIYELGGPDVLSMRQIADQVIAATARRKLVLPMPMGAARIGATMLDIAQTLTGGLFTNRILSRDQLVLLAQDNIVSPGAKGLKDLGIEPVAAEAVIDEYLWRFRPSGQFNAASQAAKNLRGQQ
ncbi:MAG: complex I NDUFA9 subunit family protein, partial [Paracoccus sp. (in: a-proteobacteria)]